MKILYIAPILPNEVALEFNVMEQKLGYWITGILDNVRNSDHDVSFLAISKGKKNGIKNIVFNKISYTYLEYNKFNNLSSYFEKNSFDIVHVFGTEHDYIVDLAQILDYKKTLIHIQGLTSAYTYHYFANIFEYNDDKNVLFYLYMKLNRQLMRKKGKNEVEFLNRAKYVTGRTSWDRALTYQINQDLVYFSFKEYLREEFFMSKWDLNKCEPHSIFISQGTYPIKATHMVVEIIKVLKKSFPDVKCYISGRNLLESKSIATKLKISYSSYIQKLIAKYDLKNNIIFVNPLDAREMIEYMNKSRVYLLPSSIENSSNSLQEAMALGIPIVASYVGGIANYCVHEKNSLLYQFDAPYMAAYYISKLFDDDEKSLELSAQSIQDINYIYSRDNISDLLSIYNQIEELSKEMEC